MRKFFATLAMVTLLMPGLAFSSEPEGNGNGNGTTIIKNQNKNNIRNRNTNKIKIRNTNKNSNRNYNTNKNSNRNYNTNKNLNKNYNTNVGINKSVNKNLNLHGQKQGQYQDQDQYQGQSQTARSKSSSKSTALAVQGQNISDKNKQDTTVNVGGDVYNSKSYASAPSMGLSALVGARCMGSVSANGSGSNGIFSFGLGFGKTYVDQDCNRRLFAAMLWTEYRPAALALLAANPEVAAALKASGVAVATLVHPEDTTIIASTTTSTERTIEGGVDYGIDFELIDE